MNATRPETVPALPARDPDPGVSTGGDVPVNLAGALARTARLHPSHGIRYLEAEGRGRFQSYPELQADAARMLSGLRALGLTAGSPVLFQFERNEDFLPAYWACVLGGYVAVPVSISPTYEQPHSTSAKLKNAWKMLGTPPVLASDSLAVRLRNFAVREGLAGLQVVTATELRAHPAAAKFTPGGPDDLALLLLTSGSTGVPKAVRQTHRNLLAWASSVAIACEFTPSDVSLNWMPLDHVGGLVMFHLRDLVLGCDQLHASPEQVLRDPLVWLDWVHQHRATITWAPNFAYALVNEHAPSVQPGRWDLSCLRFILNGGEAIVSRTARRFLALLEPHRLPATAMRPAWGMSETCSGVTYSRRFTLATTGDSDPFVEVGAPIAGIEVRIADANDEAVPAGRVGRLQIRGVSVTPGYHENPAANRASFTADGWFITGDLGIFRDGQLSITGREKDVIIINGVNFYSHELESAVEEIEGVEVSFTAACAIRPAGEDTDRIAIFFVPTAAGEGRLPELAKAIRSSVARKEGVTPDYIVPLTRDDIPKTAIGKIQRSQLREQFERGSFVSALARTVPAPDFFVPAWIPAPAGSPAPGAFAPGGVLILADAGGLAEKLASELTAAGTPCQVVQLGSAFSSGPGTHWKINANDPADYDRLVEALRAKFEVTHLLHAWTYRQSLAEPIVAKALHAAQACGSFSLLRLLKAWPVPAENAGTSLRLITVTSQLHALSDQEAADLAKGPLAGVMRTLPHEFPWLQPTLLDLPGTDPAGDLAALRAELLLPAAGEIVVREGQRHRLALRRVSLPPPGATHGRFEAGGFYVLTGGLGGIGRLVTLALAQRYQARLLLLGHTPLSPSDSTDPRVIALQALSRAGAEVRHESGDLESAEFIAGAIGRAKIAFGRPPDGFLHLAGRNREALLSAETAEAFWETVRPKLVVGWALHQASRQYPGAFTVHFSSLLAHFGALGAGAYTAANLSLDSLVNRQRRDGRSASSVLWSLWTDTGMAQGFAANDAMRIRGFLPVDPAVGPSLLEAVIRGDQPAVLIGLDGKNRLLRQQLDPTSLPAEDAASAVGYTVPRNDRERALAQMWEEILAVPRVGIHDNFFELGGRSLLAARLFARIHRELGRQLPLATLFHSPTIATLAAQLGEDPAALGFRILPLQVTGNAPPFFCIPGGGSDAIVFQDLSAALGPTQPFYGLQARGLDAVPVEGAFPSVEEVAADFIQAIRKVQPVGPYHVGGHCFGCLIAWEVATQLRAQGQEVGLLALLDPIVSNVFSGEIMGRDRLRYHFGKFLRLSTGGKFRYFAEKVRNFSRTLMVRTRISQSYDMAQSMHSRYTLKHADVPVVVFMADDSFFKLSPGSDPRRYYERISTGTLRYHDVHGDHHSILHAPGVERLAQELGAALGAAGKKS